MSPANISITVTLALYTKIKLTNRNTKKTIFLIRDSYNVSIHYYHFVVIICSSYNIHYGTKILFCATRMMFKVNHILISTFDKTKSLDHLF